MYVIKIYTIYINKQKWDCYYSRKIQSPKMIGQFTTRGEGEAELGFLILGEGCLKRNSRIKLE